MICFDENPQRQNVEEDRRGYGGRFEERACGKLSKPTKLSTEEKRESGKLRKVVQLSTEERDNVKRVRVNELSTEERENGNLVQMDQLSTEDSVKEFGQKSLSTEERACGPRRLPHVSRRGGEHSAARSRLRKFLWRRPHRGGEHSHG